MMKFVFDPSVVFPTLPNDNLDHSVTPLMNSFVFLTSEEKDKTLKDGKEDFVIVDDAKNEESDWIITEYSPENQEIENLLESDSVKEDWWKIVVSGFPNDMRAEIWRKFADQEIKALKNNYIKLLNDDCDPEVESDIIKDIDRTFTYIPNFAKYHINRLYNVLRAYAKYDPDVGYCQGMNFIVGILLLYEKDEAIAFCILVALLSKSEWRRMYIKDMPKFIEIMDKFNAKINMELPEIGLHFKNNDTNIYGLFSHFFLTIFIYGVPFAFAIRVIDMFLIKGEEVVIECLLRIMNIMKKEILERKQEEIYEYIKSNMVNQYYEENKSEAIKKLFP